MTKREAESTLQGTKDYLEQAKLTLRMKLDQVLHDLDKIPVVLHSPRGSLSSAARLLCSLLGKVDECLVDLRDVQVELQCGDEPTEEEAR